MADPKSKARVERLLRGDFRSDDLTGLFLFARDHCDGRESVTDIGDFVAHHDERNRGIITRSTRDWFTVARFHMHRFGQPGSPKDYDGKKMPPSTRDYFKIAVNRMGAQIHIRRAAAYKTMNDIAGRLKQNDDGTWALPSNLTRSEFSLIRQVCSYMMIKPAFKDDQLVDDFIATLKSNDLITKEQIREHKDSLGVLLKLYAVAAMHNCVIQIGDGITTRLTAGIPSRLTDEISVTAAALNAVPSAPDLPIASSIFTAHLPVTANCHPDLLANPKWDFEIEVAPDKRLSPLR